MIISNLFVRHKTPQPQFAPGFFMIFLSAFAIIGAQKPVLGLAGIGTLLVGFSVLVEVNRKRIWDDYRKAYRKRKGVMGLLTKPNPIYYTINVAFLWPFMLLLGFLSLWAAYMLA